LLDHVAGIDQIFAKLTRAVGNIFCSEIHKLLNSISNKEELPQEWKESVFSLFMKRVIQLTAVIIEGNHCYQLRTIFRFQG
jgi:hypothetical protein